MSQARRIMSYPRYMARTQAVSPVVPARGLLPSTQPPSATAPPHPPRPEVRIPAGWTRTQHAAPAAYPRDLREATGRFSRLNHPYRPAANGGKEKGKGEKESKEERAARIEAERDVAIGTRANAEEWSIDVARAAGSPGQWNAAERWRPSGAGNDDDGITLVLTHACGFNKEHWHPVLHHLLGGTLSAGGLFGSGTTGNLSAAPNVRINDIWLLDDTNHGESVDLNAGTLGPAFSWIDTGRDVVNFVENVLPAIDALEADGQAVPRQLEWRGSGNSPRKRRIVAVGHSYGANSLAQAAASRPELFESLFLVEPMCPPRLINYPSKGYPLTIGALKRRDTWPSLEAAKGVRDNALFKSWDQDAFDLWLSHHLVPVNSSSSGSGSSPDGPVTLATPVWTEAACFSDPVSSMRGWDALRKLEMPVGFLMAGDEFWMTGESIAGEMVWLPKRARNERVMDATHLVIQEKPKDTAEALARFLTTLDVGDWDKDSQEAPVQSRL